MPILAHPIDPRLLGIQLPYRPYLIETIKKIPGMRWDKEAKLWVGYLDAVEAAADALKSEHDVRLSMVQVSYPTRPFTREGLRDYQQAGVEFLLQNGSSGAILGDDMGLGKTATALRTMRAMGVRTLVVCPNSVKGVWVEQCKTWWPAGSEGLLVAKGTKPGFIPDDTRLVICHYEILAAWLKALSIWGVEAMFVDEGHVLVGKAAGRSKAALEIAKRASFRVVLTGTPVLNEIKSMYTMLSVVSPGRFGDPENFYNFGIRYCNGHKEEIAAIGKAVYVFDGLSNEAELKKRLEKFMLRRTKRDVTLELPDKTRQVLWLDLPKKAGRAFAAVSNKAQLRAALDAAADMKLDQVRDHLKTTQNESSVVVFCYRRAVAEWLARELGGQYVHGGMGISRRDKVIAEKPRLLAVTIDTCGVGRNDLVYAQTAVFAELTHDPQELLQAEARLHRSGQKNPVLIQYVLGKGTADERVHDVVIKRFAASENLGGVTGEALDESLRQEITEADILAQIFGGVDP